MTMIWGPVLLGQAALGHGERPRRPAVVMPVGVLATFPGQQPHIAGVGPVQGQVPAHIGVPDDEIRPQAGACRQAARDRPQLNWCKAPGRRDRADQYLSNGVLALGARTPAGLQPRAGRPTLPDAGTAWCVSDSRHATLPGEQLPSYFPGRYGGGAEEGRIGPAVERQPGNKKSHPLDAMTKRFELYGQPPVRSDGIGPTLSTYRRAILGR